VLLKSQSELIYGKKWKNQKKVGNELIYPKISENSNPYTNPSGTREEGAQLQRPAITRGMMER